MKKSAKLTQLSIISKSKMILNDNKINFSLDAGINDDQFAEICDSIESLEAFSSLFLYGNHLTDRSAVVLRNMMMNHCSTFSSISIHR